MLRICDALDALDTPDIVIVMLAKCLLMAPSLTQPNVPRRRATSDSANREIRDYRTHVSTAPASSRQCMLF